MNDKNTTQNSSPVSPSISEALKFTKQQVEAQCVSIEDKPFMNELCLIIAEVYTLSGQYPIKVAGCYRSAGDVREVFKRLTNAHLHSVINSYKFIAYQIKNKKAYLQTALYNSVFEFEANGINQFNYSYRRHFR